MEHRCSPRIATNLPVTISQYHNPIAKGRIKDATAFGFYIQSDWVARPLQQLSLEILLYKEKYTLEAIVTHANQHGFGVELEQLDDQEINLLHEFLSAQQAAQGFVKQLDQQIALVANG